MKNIGEDGDFVTGRDPQNVETLFSVIRFECNLEACRGACCTMPGAYGAPLRSEELPMIEAILPKVEKYLPARHREEVRRRGFAQGPEHHQTTVCVDNGACVFVSFDNGIARCAFETAYIAGEIDWRKPLSCHLFPLREQPGAVPGLRFEWIPECQPAIVRGEERGTALIEFLRDALVRHLGDDGYTTLHNAGDTGRDVR